MAVPLSPREQQSCSSSSRTSSPSLTSSLTSSLNIKLTIPSPQPLLNYNSGVLAEVSQSYRTSILKTCAHFLKDSTQVTHATVSSKKQAGGCNNDWVLSHTLIHEKLAAGAAAGSADEGPTLDEVTTMFELIYQGDPSNPSEYPGLCNLESLIPQRSVLLELRNRCPGKMAIVTGRPKADCAKFLALHDLTSLFDYCFCMEDGPAKPHPDPVRITCKALGVEVSTAIIVGDTPDDIRSGLQAGSRALAVATPDDFALSTLEGRLIGSKGLSLSCLDAGAEGIIEPGLEALLEYFDEVVM
jgi:HAD superfamily hydrolase (TIGR01548 family)